MGERGTREPRDAVLLWSLGERRFAVPLGAALEVTPVAALTERGRAEGARIGDLDLRGAAVPAFDARRVLGFDERPVELSDRYLVVRTSTGSAALLVDAVEGIAAARAEPARAGTDACASGVRLARIADDPEGALVQLLDLDVLLADSA